VALTRRGSRRASGIKSLHDQRLAGEALCFRDALGIYPADGFGKTVTWRAGSHACWKRLEGRTTAGSVVFVKAWAGRGHSKQRQDQLTQARALPRAR
jgi:hypothetical protein